MYSRVKSPEKFIFGGFTSILDEYRPEKPRKLLKIQHFWSKNNFSNFDFLKKASFIKVVIVHKAIVHKGSWV